jgi:hypothetical protein
MKFGNIFMRLCERIGRATQLMPKKKFMELKMNGRDLMTTFLFLESFWGMLNQLVATSLEILDDEIVGLYKVKAWKSIPKTRSSSWVKNKKIVTSTLENRFNALRDYPFELHEGIKCDMLKVSKIVSTFIKTYFQVSIYFAKFVNYSRCEKVNWK